MSMPESIREIWKDMYKLHEEFNGMGNGVDDWATWWKTAVSVIHKHNDAKLAEEMVLAITAHLESERKAKYGCETTEQSSLNTQSESRQPSQLALF